MKVFQSSFAHAWKEKEKERQTYRQKVIERREINRKMERERKAKKYIERQTNFWRKVERYRQRIQKEMETKTMVGDIHSVDEKRGTEREIQSILIKQENFKRYRDLERLRETEMECEAEDREGKRESERNRRTLFQRGRERELE